jgi:hypothetical protein
MPLTPVQQLAESFSSSSAEEKQALVKKVRRATSETRTRVDHLLQTNGVFQLNIKNKDGKEVSWV